MRFIQTFIFCFLIFGSLGAQSASSGSQIVADIEGLSAGTMKLVGVYGDRNYPGGFLPVDANAHFGFRSGKRLCLRVFIPFPARYEELFHI
ncbi:MAG: hypothetical protein R2792_16805 [Saprospiraceae bacterium]